jgi:hypothetical protein
MKSGLVGSQVQLWPRPGMPEFALPIRTALPHARQISGEGAVGRLLAGKGRSRRHRPRSAPQQLMRTIP